MQKRLIFLSFILSLFSLLSAGSPDTLWTRTYYGPEHDYGKSVQETKNVYKGNYFMLGFGFGNSYGGLGLRVQYRMGGKQGFGIHAGAGFFPNVKFLAAGVVKFFPYKDFYINAQFGLTGSEREPHYDESGYFEYADRHLLYGPSLLVGGDWNKGEIVGFGFNGGIGVTYNINAKNASNITLAIDLGFIIRF